MKQLFISILIYCGFLSLFLLWGGWGTACAQAPALSYDHFTRFHHLTTKDGLSANKVLDIHQDRYGILWFATTNGLTKYDGLRFTTYINSEDDPHSLSCNEVTALSEDTRGNLWIGTGEGLNRYDRSNDNFVRYTVGEHSDDPHHGLRSNSIKALYADSAGCLWVESAAGFLSQFDWGTKEWKHFKHAYDRHEGDYYYWHNFEDSSHHLWIGGRMMSAYRFIREAQAIEEVPLWSKEGLFLEAACFVETADKQLLSPNEGFLASYNPDKRQFEYRCQLPLHATCALLDEDGSVWIGGGGGVIRLQSDLKKGIVYRHIPQNKSSLLSDKVNCLYKDSGGILWIGTDEGASFYSEKLNAFRHYHSSAPSPYSLSSNKIQALMQDRDGLLWVGTEDHGVDTLSFPVGKVANLTYRLLTKALDEKTFNRERSVMEQYVRHELITPSTPFQAGGFQYQAFRRSEIKYNLNENNVSALYQDKSGMIYIGLWSHVGFNTYDKRTATFKRHALWSKKPDWRYPMLFEGNPFGSNWYSGFLEDSRSRFWCATWEGFGLNLFNRTTGEFDGKHYMPISSPCLPKGTVTILALLSTHGVATPFPASVVKELKGENIKAVYDDGRRFLWIGTDKELWRYDWETHALDKISLFSSRKALLDVSVITGDDVGGVYIGCAYGVALWKNGMVIREHRFDDRLAGLPGNRVNGLYLENLHRLWIATNDGLVLWDENGETNPVIFRNDEKDPYSLPDNTVHSVYMGPDSALWVAMDKGVGVYHPRTGRFEDKSLPDRTCLTSRLASCILEDHLGNIWLGTTEKGLNVLHTPEDTIAHYTCRAWDKQGLTSNCVNCLFEDSRYQIWVGTDQGLCRYRSTTDDFESPDGLRERKIQSIQEDARGYLWVATDNGLYCLSGSGQVKRVFYDYHGLQGNFFNAGASCRLQDGCLAFGGNNGFNLFQPEQMLREEAAKPVVLSNFKVRDSIRYADVNAIEQIRLPYQDNSFSVDFNAAEYEFSNHLRYRYRLLPFDKDWIYTASPFQMAKYTNLSSGDYRLEVEASKPYGEWTDAVRVLPISIATPWYLQGWFFCLSAFAFIMLILLFVHYRERKLKARAAYLEKVVEERTEELKHAVATKDKFFAIISHDLKGPCRELEQISGHLSPEVSSVAEEDTERNIYLLQHTSRHVNELLSKLLDWARAQEKRIDPHYRQADLRHEVENTVQLLLPVADKKEIRLFNRVACDVSVCTDTDMLATILRNLVSNAIKYSYRNSEVVIRAVDKGDCIEVSVIDHGVGMTEERLHKLFRIDAKLRVRGTEREQGTGLGLIVVHEFITQLGETIRVESEPDKGTAFIFTLHKKTI